MRSNDAIKYMFLISLGQGGCESSVMESFKLCEKRQSYTGSKINTKDHNCLVMVFTVTQILGIP